MQLNILLCIRIHSVSKELGSIQARRVCVGLRCYYNLIIGIQVMLCYLDLISKVKEVKIKLYTHKLKPYS